MVGISQIYLRSLLFIYNKLRVFFQSGLKCDAVYKYLEILEHV